MNLLFLGDQAGGVGRYAMELPGALLAAEPRTELHVFVSSDAPAHMRREAWATEVRWVKLPVRASVPPLHVLAQFLALPPLARARHLDVLHSPANTGPVVTPGLANVITLHDLIWLHRASEWEPSERTHRRMQILVGHCVRRTDRVFAVSHAAAEDFVRTLAVPRERIEVTRSGVRLPKAVAIDRGQLRARLRLQGARVLLCVAQKRPYKNLSRLIRAMPSLPEDVVLVLPGTPTEHEHELRTLAQELGVAARVRFPDWLSDSELDGVYALASAFVLPSLIEGFGLPVLEAMARGVPVACSDIDALREVAGEAALLFDPHRQEEITGAVSRLLSDVTLAERLVARGHERVTLFTWERTGTASLAGYRRAIDARVAARPPRANGR